MKKTFFKVKYCLILALLAAGCSNNGNQQDRNPGASMKDAVEIQETLGNTGWDVQDTSAASFHVWEQLSPSSMLLAEDAAGQVLIFGQFADPQTAENAYLSTVPLSDDSVVKEDTDTYEQAFIPLAEGQGYWLFRKAGSSVIGAWMDNEASQADFDGLFNTFLAAAPETPAENGK